MHLFGTPPALKRLVPSGLLGRSLLILIVPLVVSQLVSAFIFYDRHWDTVMRRLATAIAGDVATVVSLMARYPGEDNREWIFDMAQKSMDLTMTLRPGAVLPNSMPPYEGGLFEGGIEEAMLSAMRERVRRPVLIDTGVLDRELHMSVQLSNGVLEVVAPRKRLFSSTTYIFVMWMVGASMVLFGIATIFISNQVRSIRRLAASAEGFGKGRDLPAIKPEGAREVRQAAQSFNVMRARIRRQIDQRTEMLAGVSHDLRSPLTRMKLQLAMMGGDQDVRDLQADVAEMERMIDGYLAFARGEGTEEIASVDLVELVESVVARFRRNGAEVELTGTAGRTLPMDLRHNAVERGLSNLIGNAARYGSHVRVTLTREDRAVAIVVEDDGPGIPEEQREDVFRAFFRGEPSRNPKTGGTGLGLTIARDVARVHGGDITLHDSADLGGLKAVMRLPF